MKPNVVTSRGLSIEKTFRGTVFSQWGRYLQITVRIKSAICLRTLIAPSVPSLVPAQSPVPAAGANKGVLDDANPFTPSEKGLSSAALGGIVGVAGLALVLALVLVVVLRRRNADARGKKSNNRNQMASPPDTIETPEADLPSPPRPVMAQVVLLDEAQRESGLGFPYVPTSGSVKPGFKDQFRA